MFNKNELITELQKEIILLSDNTFYHVQTCSQLEYLLDNLIVDQRGIINDLEDEELIDMLSIIYDDKDKLISRVKLVKKILDLTAIDERLLILQDIDEETVKTLFKEIIMLANKKKDEYELIISKNKRIAKNRKNFYETMINYLKQNDDKYISMEEIFKEMRKAKLELRKTFSFKHKIGNDEIKEVEVYSEPIIINGKVYLNSSVQLVHLNDI